MVYFSHEVYICKGGNFLLEGFFREFVGTKVNEVINEQSEVELIFPSVSPRNIHGMFWVGSRPHCRRKLVFFVNDCLRFFKSIQCSLE